MPDISSYYNKPHITAYDLGGKSVNLTIKEIFLKELWDSQKMGKVKKPCINFEEAQKYFILGEKNGKKIAQVLGSRNTDDWIGQRICLYPEKKTHTQTQEAIEVIKIADKLVKSRTPQPDQDTVDQPSGQGDYEKDFTPQETEEETRARLQEKYTEENEANKKAAATGNNTW